MNRRKKAKENLHYIRKHPDSAPPNKNAASTVWHYEVRSINGLAHRVYTARPKKGRLPYAVRLIDAIRRREDDKRYIESSHRYLPELLRWQHEMRQKELIRRQQERELTNRTLSELRRPSDQTGWKNRVVCMDDDTWERLLLLRKDAETDNENKEN